MLRHALRQKLGWTLVVEVGFPWGISVLCQKKNNNLGVTGQIGEVAIP